MGGGAFATAININGGAGPVFTGGNVIEGNYFGIDPTGTQPRAQPRAITITNSPNNRIGGTTAAARNVISGSTTAGRRRSRAPARSATSSRATTSG